MTRPRKGSPPSWTADPVQFEVLRHAFMSIVDEMSLMIERVAHSLVVSEGRDFSAAICTPTGDLVAEGNVDQPSHVATLPATVKGTIAWLGYESLRDGDVVIMNDAFIGGSHCQDVRTLRPVFRDNVLVAFVVNSAHWTDAGGPVPGSFNALATDSYGEALHISPIHLVREGRFDDEVLRLILRNIRVPEITQGDIMGQVAALTAGEERLQQLMDKRGVKTVRRQMDDLIAYTERLLRAEFEKLPDGEYEFSDYVDFDPLGDHSKPVEVHLTVRIRGDSAVFDFTGTADQALGAINSPRSMTLSACAVTLKAIFPHLPQNQGILAPIEFVIPPGSVLDARFPAAVNGTFATTYEKVVGCVFGCFLQLIPEHCMVGTGNISNLAIGGFDPRPGFNRDFVLYLWRESGYGARPGKKDNHTAMSLYSSGTRNEPVELIERMYPVLSKCYEFLQDSGGAGKHRGGMGVARDIQLTSGGGVLSVMGDRGVIPAWGYEGGGPGRASGLVLDEGAESEVNVGVMASDVAVKKDTAIHFVAGGGGGWGDPHQRPAAWVLDDVIDGLVSRAAARDVYGVILRDDPALPYGLELDSEETERARSA
jgi:N-methylhydantoinase B